MTLDDVVARIRPADPQAKRKAELRQNQLTKPPGSLGRLEDLSVQLAGIFRTDRPKTRGKTVVVAAADHGVVAQGVTGYPQEVTAQMVLNFLSGGAAISVIARRADVELVIVDAGVATPLPYHADLRVVEAGKGTADITQVPAMTREQAEACVSAGVWYRAGGRGGGRRYHWHRRHGDRQHHGVERHCRSPDPQTAKGGDRTGNRTNRP